MSDLENAIPIEAFFDEHYGPNLSADPREALAEAEVIYGVDVMSGHRFVVFGRDDLERIVASGEAEELSVSYVSLDQDTDELEKLVALVKVVKGREDYSTFRPDEPPS